MHGLSQDVARHLERRPARMHGIDQSWIAQRHNNAENGGYTQCAYCHGANYTGTAMSAVPVDRTFSAGDAGSKTFTAGHQVSCYDCHNGPNGG